MLDVVLIDDETQARNALKYELREHFPDIKVLGEASSVQTGIELLKKVGPDIIFLDIRLTDGLGFDILKVLEHSNAKVIFTTAYSQYALQAIKFSALDYLLKPIGGEDLKAAIDKAQSSNADNRRSFEAYLNNANVEVSKKKIAINTSDGIQLIALRQIVYCQSNGNYTKIHFINNKHLISAKTLKSYDDLLSTSGFVRIHLSYLINLEHLTSYSNKDGGYVVLTDNQRLPVAQRKKAMLLQILNGYTK